MKELVVGSRGSQLALRQAHSVIECLSAAYPGLECRVEVIKTTGDKILDAPLAKIGDKGLFVGEIEQALMRGEIDFAVHSAKDLPSDMDESLMIAAFPKRENPADAIISKMGKLDELPCGSIVGTSSLRRQAQILHARPDLTVADLRGNVDTRLRKLDDGQYDAIILACAGLARLGLSDRITQILPYDICLPAAGQGALAIQCRRGDPAAQIIATLDDASTRACVSAERCLMFALGAGCQTPVAALADAGGDGAIHLRAMVASLDGSEIICMESSGLLEKSEELGRVLAEGLLNSDAAGLLEQARQSAGLNDIGTAG